MRSLLLLLLFSAAVLADSVDQAFPELAKTVVRDPELASAARLAKQRFVPVVAKDVDVARAVVQKDSDQLRSFLQSGAEQWFKVLQWDPQTDDPAALFEALRRLNWGYKGLESPEFRRLATALRHYIDVALAMRVPDQVNAYKKQIDLLVADVEGYPYSDTLELRIGNRLGFVAALGQAPELVSLINARHGRPNVFIGASASLLDIFTKESTRTENLHDNILGTSLNITAHTTATTSVKAVPSADKAAFQVLVRGLTNSHSVGFNGPAVIRSSAWTNFIASQYIYFTDDDWSLSRPTADATTNSNIESVQKNGGGLGKRIVAKKGTQQANAKKGQANAISSDHAEAKAKKLLNAETSTRVPELHAKYHEELHSPLDRHGINPEILYHTTNRYIVATATSIGRGQLGASADPPPPARTHDFTITLHRSAINNAASDLLSKAIIKEIKVGQRAVIDAPVPKSISNYLLPKAYDDDHGPPLDASFKPWRLELAATRPLTVDFVDNTVKMTVHMVEIHSGKDIFEHWDVTQTLTPVVKNGELTLAQSGPLEILPTGFDKNNGRLSSQLVSERTALTKVINARTVAGIGFATKFEVPTISPAKIGKLLITEFKADNGWLTIGWDREHVAR